MPENLLIPEDSADLTDADVKSAVPMACNAAVKHLSQLTCSTCEAYLRITSHELRLRKPYYYWVTGMVCGNGHINKSIVRLLDWSVPGT